jgi:hypothetical protein
MFVPIFGLVIKVLLTMAVLVQAFARLHTYLERTAYLDSYLGSTFKPSVMKKSVELDMLAINCHIQRIKVRRH